MNNIKEKYRQENIIPFLPKKLITIIKKAIDDAIIRDIEHISFIVEGKNGWDVDYFEIEEISVSGLTGVTFYLKKNEHSIRI